MMILIGLVSLVAGFVMLVKGSDNFVDGAAGIASSFGIPQIVIGLTIVAMGTSAPETAVSLTAAFSGNADITIGNVVGSNILNILVILGLASAIVPIAVLRSTVCIEMPFLIFISVMLLILGYNGTITFYDGLVMAFLFGVYMLYLVISAIRNKGQSDEEAEDHPLWRKILMLIGGLAAVVAGSKLAVYGATLIAGMLGISDRIIGLTVVALGTSLPELFTSVTAARKGNADIAIGNVVGSNVFNILFVVGLTAIITPVPFVPKFRLDGVVVVIATVALTLFSLPGKRLGRAAGISFLIGYAVYFVHLLMS